MLQLFLTSTTRFLSIALGALVRSPDGVSPIGPRRVLVMLGFIPVFTVVQAIHWLGFLLDEIFFRGYRRVVIREPLFVLGVPRSGTTNLHAVLAQDPQFTTFTTWECLFAPSVSQRRFWHALARLDARIGGPGRRLLAAAEKHIFTSLDDVHAMGLDTPEEDYFILALPFPRAAHLWRLGHFDRDMPPSQQRRLLDFYADALRRHLYVHGPDKRLLSKNAAFAPLANSLAQAFPDARFLVCLRDPTETVPSQLSSIRGGLAFFGVPPDSAPIRARFIDQLAFYYENLRTLAASGAPGRTVIKTLPQLKQDLAGSVRDAYQSLGLPLDPTFATTLTQASAPARAYRSGHRYDLAELGLDADSIVRRFAGAYSSDPAPADSADAGTAGGDETGNSTGTPPRAGAATAVAMSISAGGLPRC
jgi:hypothetical protein